MCSEYDYINSIFNLLYSYCGIDTKNTYDENLYYYTHENDFKIIDNYRVYSEYNYLFNLEVFLISYINI